MAGKISPLQMTFKCEGIAMLADKRELKREGKSTLHILSWMFMGTQIDLFVDEAKYKELTVGEAYSIRGTLQDSGNGLRINNPSFEKLDAQL